MSNKIERYEKLQHKYISMAKRKNLSECSLRNYESVTNSLKEFLKRREEQGIIGEEYVTYDDIEAWIDEMSDNGLKASTIKQKLVSVGQFFTFAAKPYIPEELRYAESPVSPDFYPKVPTENIPEALTDDEIIGLWDYKKKYSATDAQFARNYALVVLMLTTGLRNKEVLDLTLENVDLKTGEIFVHNGKGRKDRLVDMDNGADGLCAAAIENYLRVGDRPSYLPDSAPLFGTFAEHSFGTAASRNGAEPFHRGTGAWLSALVERHVKNQVGRSSVRTHDLRHTYARLTLNSTGNLAELQSQLGHSDPKISERYSGRLMARRRRAENQLILAARDKAAEQLRKRNEAEQKVIPLYA